MQEQLSAEDARQQLKKLHRERMLFNTKAKQAKQRLLEIARPEMEEKVKRPQILKSELTKIQTCMLLNISRNKLNRLIQTGVLEDLHPYTLGKHFCNRLRNSNGKAEQEYQRYLEEKKSWEDYQEKEREKIREKLQLNQ